MGFSANVRGGSLAIAGISMLLVSSCARRETNSGSAAPATSAPALSPSAAPPSRARDALFAERKIEREHLVRRALESQGISDPRVLLAMRRVPRHRFVPESARGEAYADRPLAIGWGQTISQPYIVALMTESVAIQPGDRCLEIGTGSGYQAAVLGELCKQTYSIEYMPELAKFARSNLRELGYAVELRAGDGYGGWPEAAPFDVIVITAAPERVPEPLLDQLAQGGRLVVPVGVQGDVQKLELWTRRGPGRDPSVFEHRMLADVRFVPFLGDRAR